MKNSVVTAMGIVILFIVIAGIYIISSYNSLVSLNEQVEEQYGVLESKIQRRYDLIPNLVNTVKDYLKHEEKIFLDIADARANLAKAGNVNEKINADNQLEGALSRLLAVVENYPELKSNEQVKGLMDELAGTENRISVERDNCNKVIMKYNRKVKTFPSNMIASIFNFETRPYFKAESEAVNVPKVEF